jgi:hypothetical protein
MQPYVGAAEHAPSAHGAQFVGLAAVDADMPVAVASPVGDAMQCMSILRGYTPLRQSGPVRHSDCVFHGTYMCMLLSTLYCAACMQS